MLQIFVGRTDITIIDVSNFSAQVRNVKVLEGGTYVCLRDLKAFQDFEDVEIILLRRFCSRRLTLTNELKVAIKLFMKKYHAQQDLSVDCYAFANLVKGVQKHQAFYMHNYWLVKPIRWRPPVGSVVFLLRNADNFKHAAIYIGEGLSISVWGAGGDLEIASLKSMRRDFKANRVVLATPL